MPVTNDTTDTTDHGTRAATGTRRPVPTAKVVVGLVAAVLAGVAVQLVGLPSGPTLFGTDLADLTTPVALFVALLLGSAVGVAGARAPWRVVDIVVASVLGVAGGLLFAVWNAFAYPVVSATVVPPVSAWYVGVWLLPGVLGGLVIRKPGAAVYTELVAAVLSALIGSSWGFSVVWYGLLQGLGAELVLAVFLYRWFRLPVALLAGAGAGLVVGLLDTFVYYPELTVPVQLAYIGLSIVSGVVVAGLGAWALTRALARTGALAPLRSGRDAERV
ncbi:ECF transporter S component [Aquipuribacter sp. SD81]|uniref:ECF transporter S component n=1 Tax=Aquipuribacter sp. SD81 TaxID=3127703 RepID=UPI00301A8F05